MTDNNFSSIKIPKVLLWRATPILLENGYRSFSDLVIDATRRRLDVVEDESKREYFKRKAREWRQKNPNYESIQNIKKRLGETLDNC